MRSFSALNRYEVHGIGDAFVEVSSWHRTQRPQAPRYWGRDADGWATIRPSGQDHWTPVQQTPAVPTGHRRARVRQLTFGR